ncbi:MAG: radical SAM protein [Candidatus Lernaella stagnicola]|nr:radical SAM protein [Candidatus Lernaella stagnicola]
MGLNGRVLLLQAPVPGSHNRLVAKPSAIPPLGIGYLASVLIRDGFDVRLHDMDVEDIDVEPLRAILADFQPAVVGISTTTLTFKNGLRVAKVVKEQLRTSVVCLGGPHVSVRPQDALQNAFVDLVICGEGERSFQELCRAVAAKKPLPAEIPGTVWKVGPKTKTMPKRERIRDLDALPFPARHLMPLDRYNIPGTVLTSRGCPFNCGFCAGPVVLGRAYIERSAERVVDEVQLCIDMFGLTSFYFVDDTMTHNIARLGRICDGLTKIRVPEKLGRKLKWTCESRADVISAEILQRMRDAGCTTIQFGMESGSQDLLNKLGKKITLQQVENAVKWSVDAGISPVLSMVFPHPDETRQTMEQSFDFVRKLYDLGVEKIIPALLTLFPGTRFMDQKEELGLTLLTDDTDEYNLGTPILTTRHMTREDISNGYTQLLMLTQLNGRDLVGGISLKPS